MIVLDADVVITELPKEELPLGEKGWRLTDSEENLILRYHIDQNDQSPTGKMLHVYMEDELLKTPWAYEKEANLELVNDFIGLYLKYKDFEVKVVYF